MYAPNASTSTPRNASESRPITNDMGQGGFSGEDDPTWLSTNVGRIEVVLPSGFTATGATALRSYGWATIDPESQYEENRRQEWDDVPDGSPRYWIAEPVLLNTAGGKASVEVTLPGGNIISIMVKGTWGGRDHASPERVRPFNVE